ncbi:hypothetical protein [Rhizobium sp. BK176]|uniref:hypothetical protein n=1 Tax=Rhizobium sp. BK176 TaxID=2587071 RepID=UPI0021695F45|nr:hypothetical protein [Rhizobium sp. BK176]MCS4089043.1 hypothetical protein [Rhizobium sp. BK176]
MRIEVDFPVITTGLAPRGKGPKPVVARRTITVDLPEYSEAEAPVAMTTTFHPDSDPGSEGLRYRGVGENLYRPSEIEITEGRVRHRFSFDYIPQSVGIHEHLNDDISKLLHRLRDQYSTSLPSAIIPSSLGQYRLQHDRAGAENRFIELPSISELGLKEFDEQAVEVQTATFRDHMTRFVRVGAKMQIATGEPFYACSFIGANSPASLTVEESDFSGKIEDNIRSSYAIACFRADESHDHIHDEIRRISTLSGQERRVPGDNAHRIHVFDPAYVTFDAAAANLRLAARSAIKGFVADTARSMTPFNHRALAAALLSMPMETFKAHRSLELALAENDYHGIADILPHFARFQPGVGAGTDFSRSEAMINDVLDRWENRPVRAFELNAKSCQASAM